MKNIFENFVKESKGSMTVFMVCLLIPLILFEGLIIDSVRMIGAKQVASDASDLTINSELANYNHTLKQAYGLLAFDGIAVSPDYYFKANINPVYAPNVSTSGSATFLPMSGNASVSYIEGSSLGNENVLKGQIMQFEKYYAKATMEDMDIVMLNLDKMPDMYTVLEGKINYDIKLYQVQQEYQEAFNCMVQTSSVLGGISVSGEIVLGDITEEMKLQVNQHMQLAITYANELPGLWSQWNTNIVNLNIPGTFRNYMSGQANTTKDLITSQELEKTRIFLQKLMEADPNLESYLDGDVEKLMAYLVNDYELKRSYKYNMFFSGVNNMIRCADMRHCRYISPDVIYDEYSPETVAFRYVTSNEDSYCYDGIKIAQDSLCALKQAADFYGETEGIQNILDTCNNNYLLEEYALAMYPCFYRNPVNLNGVDYTLYTESYGTDAEYLAFGHGVSIENANDAFAATMMYGFFWDVMYNFSENTYEQSTANLESMEVTKVYNPATPLMFDICSMATAALEIHGQMMGSGKYDMTNYRGDGQFVTMRYKDFVRYYLFRTLAMGKEEIVLQRMKCVMENSMNYCGYGGFSLDNAYTMLELNATVNVKSSFLRDVSFSVSDMGGY